MSSENISPDQSIQSPAAAPDKLVYMANQIGRFFATQSETQTVAGVADHIRKFWEPRMRSAIFAYLDAGGAGLDDNVRRALDMLRDERAGA